MSECDHDEGQLREPCRKCVYLNNIALCRVKCNKELIRHNLGRRTHPEQLR